MVSNSGTIGRVAALHPGGVAKESGGLGQQIRAEHVAHAPGHAEHERAEGLAVDLLPELADQLEHAQRLGRLRTASAGGWLPAVSGRASSAAIHCRHASEFCSGGLTACPPVRPRPSVRHRSASAALSLVVFSRTSSRTVENRNDSTSRRTGRTRVAARDALPPDFQGVLDQPEIGDQRFGRGVARRVR